SPHLSHFSPPGRSTTLVFSCSPASANRMILPQAAARSAAISRTRSALELQPHSSISRSTASWAQARQGFCSVISTATILIVPDSTSFAAVILRRAVTAFSLLRHLVCCQIPSKPPGERNGRKLQFLTRSE